MWRGEGEVGPTHKWKTGQKPVEGSSPLPRPAILPLSQLFTAFGFLSYLLRFAFQFCVSNVIIKTNPLCGGKGHLFDFRVISIKSKYIF